MAISRVSKSYLSYRAVDETRRTKSAPEPTPGFLVLPDFLLAIVAAQLKNTGIASLCN